jgi:hypothetical protein
MSLPKRFIDEGSDADDFERAVLGAELDAAPPTEAEERVLASVLFAVASPLPVPSLPTGAAASAKSGGVAAFAKTAATLGFGKGFVVGIGVSIAAASGSHLLGGPSPFHRAAPSPSAPAAIVAPVVGATPASAADAPGVVAPQPGEETEPPAPVAPRNANEASGLRGASGVAVPFASNAPAVSKPSVAPSVASFPADKRALAASRLKEESALLLRARTELRAGALAAAFATLEASRQRFTAPELSQEREALVIELLYRSGERTAAAGRAREFLARFPESPHAAAVRTFAGDAR